MRIFPLILLLGLVLGGAQPGAGLQKENRPVPFILFATVFTEQGLAFPGAEARLRRAGEKKVRWEAVSDSRGEFALRVPPGAEYELSVTAKGFQPITQKVDARESSRLDLSLHLFPASKDKKEKVPGKQHQHQKQEDKSPEVKPT